MVLSKIYRLSRLLSRILRRLLSRERVGREAEDSFPLPLLKKIFFKLHSRLQSKLATDETGAIRTRTRIFRET